MLRLSQAGFWSLEFWCKEGLLSLRYLIYFRGSRLEVGGWKLEVRGWKLEARGWRLEG